jgi:hypothetical protein
MKYSPPFLFANPSKREIIPVGFALKIQALRFHKVSTVR